nr:MAG TPA: Saposin-like protein family protein 5-5, saposin-like fold, ANTIMICROBIAL PROTEIN [Caudoviricetes sp.]
MNGSVHQSGIDVGGVCDMCRFLLCHIYSIVGCYN